MKFRIPLSRPSLGAAEAEAAARAVASGWLSQGERTLELEASFAGRMGARHALATSSCTGALYLAGAALGIGRGDEVIVPALTYVATANAFAALGAKVVFADSVSEEEPTLSPADAAARITPCTRAICAVHYAGFLADVDALAGLCRTNGIHLIEDAAHAPLARRDGPEPDGPRAAGTFGTFGAFSFYATKNMTCGEGGMLLTPDPSRAERAARLRTHGVTSSTLARHGQAAPVYDVPEPGLNFNLDEIRAAVALVQLSRLDELTDARRALLAAYRTLLARVPGVRVPFSGRDVRRAAPHILPVIVEADPERVRARLAAEGIQTGRHYPLLPTLTAYRDPSFASRNPGLARLISLPFYPGLSAEQAEEVAGALARAVALG